MTGQSKPVNPDTFAFWKLPPLARSHVTKQMEQEDVIHLSMHSKPFKRLLKAFKIRGASIRFHFWCNIPENDDFSEECHIIETYYSPSYNNVELWCPHPDHRKIPENERMLVHNNQMLVGREQKKFEVNSALTFQEKLKTLEQITFHLMEIFHVERFDLEYNHTKETHIFGSFVWDIVDKFRSISIQPYNAPDREDIFGEVEKENFDNLYGLSHEQVKFLFNDVKTDSLDYAGHVSNSEELTGIHLKHRKMEVWVREGLDWVTMDHVIDSECEELSVKFEDVEEDEIVELLEKWQSGEKLVNLKKLELSFMVEDKHQPLIDMLGKLNGVKMYSSQEAARFAQRSHVSTIEVGPYAVRRTTDGFIATFCVLDMNVHFLCD